MKRLNRYIPFCIIIVLLFVSCGYHNPNVYTGPAKAIYMPNWKNRTNQLGLDASIYQSLVRWYQNSESLSIIKKKEDAQLILAGEIISIDLPSLSYNSSKTASEIKVRLKVRYVMKDLATDTIIIEEPGQTWSESYLVGKSTAETRDYQNKALATIIDDLSESIYQKTIAQIQSL